MICWCDNWSTSFTAIRLHVQSLKWRTSFVVWRIYGGPGESILCVTRYGTGWSGVRKQLRASLYRPVHIGPEAHLSSCKMCTRYLYRGVVLISHLSSSARVEHRYSYSCTLLCACLVCNGAACTSIYIYLFTYWCYVANTTSLPTWLDMCLLNIIVKYFIDYGF